VLPDLPDRGEIYFVFMEKLLYDVYGKDPLLSTSGHSTVAGLDCDVNLLSAWRERPTMEEIIVAKYAVKQLIGVGGFARVYLGEELLSKRQVAIKAIPLKDHFQTENYTNELTNLAKLDTSDAILRLYTHEQDDHYFYIIMEYAENRSLKEYLAQHAPLSLGQSIKLLVQILRGLIEAHAVGIIHRDIKPANLLFRGTKLKISDFGISKSLKAEEKLLTQVGTVCYMAPEQLEGQEYQANVDLFATGCVLYEMLFGQRARRNMEQILNRKSIPIPAGLPVDLQKILEKSLHPDPLWRYQSAQEMLNDIKKFSSSPGYQPEMIIGQHASGVNPGDAVAAEANSAPSPIPSSPPRSPRSDDEFDRDVFEQELTQELPFTKVNSSWEEASTLNRPNSSSPHSAQSNRSGSLGLNQFDLDALLAEEDSETIRLHRASQEQRLHATSQANKARTLAGRTNKPQPLPTLQPESNPAQLEYVVMMSQASAEQQEALQRNTHNFRKLIVIILIVLGSPLISYYVFFHSLVTFLQDPAQNPVVSWVKRELLQFIPQTFMKDKYQQVKIDEVKRKFREERLARAKEANSGDFEPTRASNRSRQADRGGTSSAERQSPNKAAGVKAGPKQNLDKSAANSGTPPLAAPSIAKPAGLVYLTANRIVQIQLDGQSAGEIDKKQIPLSLGSHTLAVSYEDYDRVEQKFEIHSGKDSLCMIDVSDGRIQINCVN
jgi:serine/threonine protein kinase